MTLRRLVVPLDGSPSGEHALPFARAIAQRAGAALDLVHVHEAGAGAVPDRWDAELRAREQAYLDETADRLRAANRVAVRIALLEGDVAPAVARYAADQDADLIVLTTHGETGFAREWLGSTADALARVAPVPLLLVRPPDSEPDLSRDRPLHNILVPLTGAPPAERALALAMELGRLMDARYTLLSVVPPPVEIGRTTGAPSSAEAREAAGREDRAHRYLGTLANDLERRAFCVQHRVLVHPSPAAAIVEYARDAAPDLITLTATDRQAHAFRMLGSVADKVLRAAPVPVLLIGPAVPRPPVEAGPAASSAQQPARTDTGRADARRAAATGALP